MSFQNTIAYATFTNAGGQMNNLVGSSYEVFEFNAEAVNYNKNIVTTAPSDQSFQIKVLQNGAYWIDFSFMAGGGDSKNYFIKPFLNDSTYNDLMTVQFYQQPTNQQYEVSHTGIYLLTKDDIFDFRIYVSGAGPSATDFYARNLKYTVFNLQQIGIH